MDIYYPYVQNQAKGEELRYSLRSLEQHVKFDYEVYVVGDKPSWLKGVRHIPTPPPPPHHFGSPTTYDAASKLETYLNTTGTDCMFIRMYDDIYFLQDYTEQDAYNFYTLGDWSDKPLVPANTWGRQLLFTIEKLKESGYKQFNTETHLPELFTKRHMKEVMEKFNPKQNRLLTSTLYANYTGRLLQELTPGIRACFYDQGHKNAFYENRLDRIRDICSKHKFLNHDDPGYSAGMIAFLKERFPNKSRFEND